MKRNIIFAIASLSIGIILGVSVYLYHYFYPQNYVKTDKGEYVHITVANNKNTFPVTKDTEFEIEHYYAEEDRLLTEDAGNLPVLIGCDKEGVLSYLKEYMKHLDMEERTQGLSSFELISYSDNVIKLRKTYTKPSYEGFFAKNFNGYIVILNGDEKTVYEYTQISVHLLPEDIQKELKSGYYLEDETQLYNFLETYSS